MKKKLIIIIPFVLIIVSIFIFVFIYVDDRAVKETSKYTYQCYSIQKNDGSVIFTKYETTTEPIKSVITYYYESGKFVKTITSDHYLSKVAAKEVYKNLADKNNVTVKDNVIIHNEIDTEQYTNVNQNELVNMLEKRYDNNKTYRKVSL